MENQEECTYFNDVEHPGEMARLLKQSRIITKELGGLFPEQFALSTTQDVLDIACGPGTWVLDVAKAYPSMRVYGIDKSTNMINFAQVANKTVTNAHFQVMDATHALDFPDASFDFVNARLIFGFMTPETWPGLLKECYRILRPGGTLHMTESEAPITNQPAVEQLNSLFAQAHKKACQSFSVDGRHVGITPMLSRLMKEAGFQHVQKQAYTLDYSAGTSYQDVVYQDFMIGFQLLQAFLIKMDVTTFEEVVDLYNQALREMQSQDLCAIWYFLSVWGSKPS